MRYLRLNEAVRLPELEKMDAALNELNRKVLKLKTNLHDEKQKVYRECQEHRKWLEENCDAETN